MAQRVILRDLRPEDWWQVARWEEDDEILEYLGKKPLTALPRADLGRRRRVLGIDVEGGRFVGYVELREINWRRRSGELRICIGEKYYWGRGYGTAAMRLFIDICFDRLGLEYLYLRVYRTNRRAIRCYEKCGFRAEGVLRGGRLDDGDIILMGMHRRDVAVVRSGWQSPQALTSGSPNG